MNTTVNNSAKTINVTSMETTTLKPFFGRIELPTGDDNKRNVVRTPVNTPDGVTSFNSTNAASGLEQIVMWPGGKKNELKHILPALPSYKRYFELFCGGGSVYMGLRANEYFINDFSSDHTSYKNNCGTEYLIITNYLNDSQTGSLAV